MFTLLFKQLLSLIGITVLVAITLSIIAFIGAITYLTIKECIKAVCKADLNKKENKDVK